MSKLHKFFFVAILLVTNIQAGVIQVPADQPTIQAGINTADEGDTVLVAENVYFENIDFKGKAITVASYFLLDGDTTHINNTVIDGSRPTDPNKGSVVSFVSGEDTLSVICGFTLTGGTGTITTIFVAGTPYQMKVGGGIFCDSSGARILNNKIINNHVISLEIDVAGGALMALPYENNHAWIVLRDNQIIHNTITTDEGSAWGGGIEIFCNGKLIHNNISYNSVIFNGLTNQAGAGGVDCTSQITDRREVIFESNQITHNSVVSYSNTVPSALGGGISIEGCQGRFSKNEVSDNEIWVKSDQYGCGAGLQLLKLPDSFIIEANIIRENKVIQGNGYGGGFNIHTNSAPTLINNIIDRNVATNGGAFLISGNCTVKLINNTAIDNKATTGGGIYLDGNSSVYLMNSILWDNQAPTHAGIHVLSGSTTRAAYSDIQGGWSGTGNINLNPSFADALFHLSDDSPCIGKGVASFDFGNGVICTSPESDFSGNVRPNPAESDPDIGAQESPLKEPKNVSAPADPTDALPKTYSLAQNFPNPFNPVTSIEFALPKDSFVNLKIYNLIGQEVTSLVAEKRPVGMHQINWDATGLASGVYLCRLEAGEFVRVKKLILIR